MVLKILKIVLSVSILFGLMGTSCIRDGGYAYQKFFLNKCPPEEFALPLEQKNRQRQTAITVDDKPVYGCADVGSYLYFIKGRRTGDIFYPLLRSEKGRCVLFVAFEVNHGKLFGTLPEVNQSYTYKLNVDHLRGFAETLLSGTKLEIIETSKIVEVGVAGKDIDDLCKRVKAQ